MTAAPHTVLQLWPAAASYIVTSFVPAGTDTSSSNSVSATAAYVLVGWSFWSIVVPKLLCDCAGVAHPFPCAVAPHVSESMGDVSELPVITSSQSMARDRFMVDNHLRLPRKTRKGSLEGTLRARETEKIKL